MRVLLVGEGKHDVGAAGADTQAPPDQRKMGGVVGTLVRKQCPAIAADSPARLWREIPRYGRGWPGKPHGYAGKVAAAIILAERTLRTDGIICVLDRDGEDQRAGEMEQGRQRGQEQVRPGFRVVCGLAVESIEAWTLGAKSALAEELGLPVGALAKLYPPGVGIEELSEKSQKSERRPKALLEKLASRANRRDGSELREAVAERSDFAELAKNCPSGFAGFATALRAVFIDALPGLRAGG